MRVQQGRHETDEVVDIKECLKLLLSKSVVSLIERCVAQLRLDRSE